MHLQQNSEILNVDAKVPTIPSISIKSSNSNGGEKGKKNIVQWPAKVWLFFPLRYGKETTWDKHVCSHFFFLAHFFLNSIRNICNLNRDSIHLEANQTYSSLSLSE